MRKLLMLLALVLVVAACGDDEGGDTTVVTDGADTSVTSEATDTTGDQATGEQVNIVGVDYAFQGVPESVPVGTELTFSNESEAEVHEMVLVRIDDDETRPLDELLGIPEEEAGEVTEFKGVSVAFPGEDGTVVDGSLVVDEPGRYALLCFIPTGADPQAFRDAIESGDTEEAPEVEGGPPHMTQGMAAELTVTGG